MTRLQVAHVQELLEGQLGACKAVEEQRWIRADERLGAIEKDVATMAAQIDGMRKLWWQIAGGAAVLFFLIQAVAGGLGKWIAAQALR